MRLLSKIFNKDSGIPRVLTVGGCQKALIDAMTEAGIDNAVRSKIADKYQAAISEQSKKISTAKDWVDTLISDVE